MRFEFFYKFKACGPGKMITIYQCDSPFFANVIDSILEQTEQEANNVRLLRKKRHLILALSVSWRRCGVVLLRSPRTIKNNSIDIVMFSLCMIYLLLWLSPVSLAEKCLQSVEMSLTPTFSHIQSIECGLSISGGSMDLSSLTFSTVDDQSSPMVQPSIVSQSDAEWMAYQVSGTINWLIFVFCMY